MRGATTVQVCDFNQIMDKLVGTNLKMVLVGDYNVGKTSLILTYSRNVFPDPTVYVPKSHDDGVQVKLSNGDTVNILLADTSSTGEDYHRFRPFTYPGTDVVLICFSVEKRTSFASVTEYWLPELKQHIRKVPVLLVGCKSDLRKEGDPSKFVSYEEAQCLAKELGTEYCETSSRLLRDGVKECMDTAISMGLDVQFKRQRTSFFKRWLCFGGSSATSEET